MTTSSMPAAVSVGVVLGETYEIARLLGEGGMGSVWEAKHLRLPGKRFAVKVLHGQAALDPEAYARFRREAEIASRIGHPNIIEVLDWNTLPSGTPYLVLEYLDGEDLANRLGGGAMPVDQALAITRQIGSALKAAHAAEVVHRDLKPGNVFLVPREVAGEITDHVKVLDFGISKIRNSNTVQTQDAVLLGTPQYMAPEQAQGKNNEIDARTDIFALGAICYEMLSGRPPFSGDSLAQVVFKVVYEPAPPLASLVPGIAPEIVAAVERAMMKDPADRFSDMSSFIGALTGRTLATTDRRAVRGSVSASAVPADSTQHDQAASQLRGEMQTRVSAPGGSRKLAFLAAAILVGAGGTYAGVQLLGGPRTTEPPPLARPAAQPPTRPVSGEVPVAAPRPAVDPPVAPSTPPSPAHVEPPVEPEPKKIEAKPHAGAPSAVESPKVKELLDEAEQTLRGGDAGQALVIADRALREQKTSRAFAIQTRAHCSKGDLGSANATFLHIAAADRARVRKECKAHDVDLR